MKKIFNNITAILIFGTPLFSFAAETKDFKWLISFIISSFLEPATILIMSFAVVFFLWNIMQVIRNSDKPDELEKFKEKALWGIIAIAVMVSMWGLVYFVTDSLKLNTTTPIVVPLPTF